MYLLYSTGKYTQYLAITYNEENVKINTYMYIKKTESLRCTPEANTTL